MATSSSSSSSNGAQTNGAQSNNVEHTDALVVGGGPIGLLIAAQLVRFGCTAIVIERDDKPSMPIYGRATTLWCRTLELLDQLGLCDPLMEEGCFTKDGVNFRNGKAVPGGCVRSAVKCLGGAVAVRRASTLMPSHGGPVSVQTDLWAGEQVLKKRDCCSNTLSIPQGWLEQAQLTLDPFDLPAHEQARRHALQPLVRTYLLLLSSTSYEPRLTSVHARTCLCAHAGSTSANA